MENIMSYFLASGWVSWLLFAVLGLILGWFLWGRGSKNVGDLSIEGEGQLRAEADSLRARINELEGNLSANDSEMSGLKSSLAAAGTGAVATKAAANDDDETYALEWRNRYLAARVKYLEGRVAEGGPKKKAPAKKKAVAKKTAAPKKVVAKKPAVKKPAAKKPAAKKAAPKKAAPKKAPAKKKAVAKKATAVAAKAKAKPAAKKAAPKKAAAKKAAPKKATANDKYYAKIRKYDARASTSVIDNIVKYCGPSLKSRDASLVACTDEAELDRIVKGFCTKKLGLKTGQKELVAKTCQQMKADRMKNRAVFYYLTAKSAGKLSLFK
jgi:hypothetical protein